MPIQSSPLTPLPPPLPPLPPPLSKAMSTDVRRSQGTQGVIELRL